MIKEKLQKIWEWVKAKGKKIIAGIVALATIGLLGAQIINPPIPDIALEKIQQKYEQATEIKAKYVLEGASLKRIAKDDPKDRIEVVIGNRDLPEFVPEVAISRWDEVSFKIKPNLESIATKDKTLDFVGNKIIFCTPKISFEMYEYTEGEGGYKFIWYLNEKPATNKVEFSLNTKGLDFFYQPPLTQKEIDEGCVRPENVVGSYAVYHQTKGRMNDINGKDYKVGKFGHIYRPKIIDAEGKEIWGILNIDAEKGIYSVEIPQDFLDTATYPIKSNDTFGYTTFGGSGGSQDADRIRLRVGSVTSSGTLDKTTIAIAFAVDYSADGIAGAVYDSSLNLIDESGNLSTSGVPYDPAVDPPRYGYIDWVDRTLNGEGVSTGTYYASYAFDGTGDSALYAYDSGGVSGESKWKTETIANPWTFPNPISSLNDSTTKYSIYATYTPAGEEEAPVQSQIMWIE